MIKTEIAINLILGLICWNMEAALKYGMVIDRSFPGPTEVITKKIQSSITYFIWSRNLNIYINVEMLRWSQAIHLNTEIEKIEIIHVVRLKFEEKTKEHLEINLPEYYLIIFYLH